MADNKKKHFALNLIQIAWVVEVMVLLAFTFILILFSWTERFAMWTQVMPQLVLLIGGQGAIAGGGPLVSQALENGKHKSMEEEL